MGRTINFIFSLTIAIVLSGCENDNIVPGVLVPVSPLDELSLTIVDNSIVDTRSTTVTAAELNIHSGSVYVFAANGGAWLKTLPIVVKSGEGSATPIISVPDISKTVAGSKFVIVLNSERTGTITNFSTFNSHFLVSGGLIDGSNDFIGEGAIGNYLPMRSGEETWNPADATAAPTKEISITRAVAKVQVKLIDGITASGGVGATHFSASNVKYKIFQYAQSGNILDGTTKTTQVAAITTIPETGIVYNSVETITGIGAVDSDNNLGSSYIYSFPYSTKMLGAGTGTTTIANTPAIDVAIRIYDTKRLAIILQVRHVSGEYANTYRYYRLDFCSKVVDGAPVYHDVDPNTHYKINISSVKHLGFPSAREALLHPPGNIDYDVEVGDGDLVVSDGLYTLIIDKSTEAEEINVHESYVRNYVITGMIKSADGVPSTNAVWSHTGDPNKFDITMPRTISMNGNMKAHNFTVELKKGQTVTPADKITFSVSYGNTGVKYTSPTYTLNDITDTAGPYSIVFDAGGATYDYNFLVGTGSATVNYTLTQADGWEGFVLGDTPEVVATKTGNTGSFTASATNDVLNVSASATGLVSHETGVTLKVVNSGKVPISAATKTIYFRKVIEKLDVSQSSDLVLNTASTGVSWTSHTSDYYTKEGENFTIPSPSGGGGTTWHKLKSDGSAYEDSTKDVADAVPVLSGTDGGTRVGETTYTTFEGAKSGTTGVTGKLWSKVALWIVSAAPGDEVYIGRWGSPVTTTTGENAGHFLKRASMKKSDASGSSGTIWGANTHYYSNIAAQSGNFLTYMTDGKFIANYMIDNNHMTAAKAKAINLCYTIGVDWYLPAIDQLRGMHVLKDATAGDYSFGSDYYWSATEDDASYAWYVNFNDGRVTSINNKNHIFGVRCVRDL